MDVQYCDGAFRVQLPDSQEDCTKLLDGFDWLCSMWESDRERFIEIMEGYGSKEDPLAVFGFLRSCRDQLRKMLAN
jgi:hypothetical protein